MPMHHGVLLAAHDGSLGAVRVIRVQKGRVTIETITELSDREGERRAESANNRSHKSAPSPNHACTRSPARMHTETPQKNRSQGPITAMPS